jgi:DNA-binding MarR family transcriptional regulator
MPRKAANSSHSPDERDVFRLLRYSHIFASTVQQVLEIELLRKATPLPLNVSQFHVLKLMTLNGRHQVGEVADFLGVSPPAATKNIDKLERYGLMVRSPSKGDRRATLLSVSPKGRRLVERFDQLKTERLAPVIESLQPEELEQLTSLLQRVSISLLEDQSADGFCLRCAAYLAEDCPVGQARGGCPYHKLRGIRRERAAAESRT